MNVIHSTETARLYLSQGKILAYPTEAVYGLGCDAFNRHAVERILQLKQRDVSKGLIILIADWTQLFDLIQNIADNVLEMVRATWPGPVTWVFPKSKKIPTWLSGSYDTIAIRMTAHALAHELCIDGPIVSTSANPASQSPAVSLETLRNYFPNGIDAVMAGSLGEATKPSAIYHALTGEQLR